MLWVSQDMRISKTRRVLGLPKQLVLYLLCIKILNRVLLREQGKEQTKFLLSGAQMFIVITPSHWNQRQQPHEPKLQFIKQKPMTFLMKCFPL